MPIYEYYCPKCRQEKEMLQKTTDPAPLCVCEDGDPTEMLRKLSQTGGFILKGKGWYKTDYAKSK